MIEPTFKDGSGASSLLTYTWRVWPVGFNSGPGLNFCYYFVFSMLSNTYTGARKIQWGISRVCKVNSNI